MVYIAVDRVLAKSWCISIYPDTTRMDRRLSFFLFNHTHIVTAYLDLWTHELCGFLPLYHFLLCALTVVAITIVEYLSTKEEWGTYLPLYCAPLPPPSGFPPAPHGCQPLLIDHACDSPAWARPGRLGQKRWRTVVLGRLRTTLARAVQSSPGLASAEHQHP